MMSSYLCISVRFLQPLCHGRAEGNEPEWPVSPLRLFQALVAAAAARWNERVRLEYALPALRWLEQRESPILVAPAAKQADQPYRLYVPDNIGDKVGASWSRGRAAAIADYRTEKDVRPTYLDGEAIHYLFALSDTDSEFSKHRETLATAARSITHLGWGIDMVAGDSSVITEEEMTKLPGERWLPTGAGHTPGLRVPHIGTLDDLVRKHNAFLTDSSATPTVTNPLTRSLPYPSSELSVIAAPMIRAPAPMPHLPFTVLTKTRCGLFLPHEL